MAKSPNPRRARGFPKEHVGKPRAMAMIRQIAEPDPQCILHVPNPFDVLFPEGRPLEGIDYMDLDGLCTCKFEAMDPVPKRTEPRPPKTCPRCRIRRSRVGTCFCD